MKSPRFPNLHDHYPVGSLWIDSSNKSVFEKRERPCWKYLGKAKATDILSVLKVRRYHKQPHKKDIQ